MLRHGQDRFTRFIELAGDFLERSVRFDRPEIALHVLFDIQADSPRGKGFGLEILLFRLNNEIYEFLLARALEQRIPEIFVLYETGYPRQGLDVRAGNITG